MPALSECRGLRCLALFRSSSSGSCERLRGLGSPWRWPSGSSSLSVSARRGVGSVGSSGSWACQLGGGALRDSVHPVQYPCRDALESRDRDHGVEHCGVAAFSGAPNAAWIEERAVQLQPHVVVEAGGVVLVHYERRLLRRRLRGARRRLGRDGEIALRLVLRQSLAQGRPVLAGAPARGRPGRALASFFYLGRARPYAQHAARPEEVFAPPAASSVVVHVHVDLDDAAVSEEDMTGVG